MPEALLQSFSLLFAGSVALPHAKIGLPQPFSCWALAKIMEQTVPQEPGIEARIERDCLLHDLVQRIQLCGLSHKVDDSLRAFCEHTGSGIYQRKGGEALAVVERVIEGIE